MFIKKSKYEVEKLIAAQRIETLESIICPDGHDYKLIGTKFVGSGQGYGDLYHIVYRCSRCKKLLEVGLYDDIIGECSSSCNGREQA